MGREIRRHAPSPASPASALAHRGLCPGVPELVPHRLRRHAGGGTASAVAEGCEPPRILVINDDPQTLPVVQDALAEAGRAPIGPLTQRTSSASSEARGRS